MSDKKAPEPEGQPQPMPDWGVTKEGRIIIEGADVTNIVMPGFENRKPEETPEPEPPAVEGEEAEPEAEPEPEKKAEPTPKEEEAAEEESEEAEEEAEEKPEAWKFKLKFRGQEEEKEYTRDQLQVRLNKLRAFEENEKEFWIKRKEVEPYAEIVESDWFKEKLREAYETGELQRPQKPPEPPAVVRYEVMKRQAEPDYPEVLNALQLYAMNLSPDAVQLLDSDPQVFIAEYDRIAAEVRGQKPQSGQDTPEKKPEKKVAKLSPEEVKAKLQLKEKSKEKASVAKPGQAQEPVSEKKAWDARRKELERNMKNSAGTGHHLATVAELLMHMEKQPT